MTAMNEIPDEELREELERREERARQQFFSLQDGMHEFVMEVMRRPETDKVRQQLGADLLRCLGRSDRELFMADPSRFSVQFDICYSRELVERKGYL